MPQIYVTLWVNTIVKMLTILATVVTKFDRFDVKKSIPPSDRTSSWLQRL
jgi:hypothetical protein